MSNPQKVLSATEPWAEYQLEDGTTLRFRLTACNFRRTGKTTDQGDPEYSFQHQMQVETIARTQAAKLYSLVAPEERFEMEARYDLRYGPGVKFNTKETDTTPSEYSAPVEDAG